MDYLALTFLFAFSLAMQIGGFYAIPLLAFSAAGWGVFALSLILYYASVESVYLAFLFMGLAVFNMYEFIVSTLRAREEKW